MFSNRNAKCWCGSGLKYKRCHLEFDEKLESLKLKGEIVPPREVIKSPEDIEGIKKSSEVNNGVLDLVASKIKAGMSTLDIDKLVYDYTVEHGAIPAPLNFEGFPKSVCTSINNEVCHGIPDEKIILKDGDIVNVDVSTILNGYYSDASRMFMIGEVSEDAKKLVEVAKECMEAGIKAIKPWGHLGDIGAACQEVAHKNGYTIVRALGGHGVGNQFHEEPFVPHIGKKGTDMILVPGMVLTVEPMVNAGGYDVYVDAENEWTIYTEDDSLSAQWEHTVLITETGVEILAK
ncbi:methionine aminopeptidase [Clostridium botulinum]|uniref:Methionine aminopeptidase n=1 Tax=Clostridium botulinum (strain Eklund 17B / Type B) TaxID=935198 RepID=B2TJC3_CLOBB|nr:methionyl aminopeptidase [Clostridium botulinum]ACD22906.1 methionine aminopeptidase, type I [Clostridium botulinum B str. Eklund 17B (NRP)]ACD53417.1 methionine aminopeptidase, type I [Clostridium botulinum E3 str. Alaska E43]AJF29297.1 methionine aminopeptidase [Clostridium botulinum]AJF32358.1 methionine aminopeptidase [Clostridium botulinum]MBY6789570.1 methionyl aminopeptidase [Clostridium botulinum]